MVSGTRNKRVHSYDKFKLMFLLPLRKGNVFTSVCHYSCPREGGLPGLPGGSLHPGGLPRGGLHPEGYWADPFPHQILWDTVNERAVHILLECILVSEVISLHELNQ